MTTPMQAQIEAAQLAKWIKELKWKSIEKDNMEFEVRTTCYVKDALDKWAAAAQVGEPQTTVPLSVYESAVRGRQDMRQALRAKREQADKYGVVLMMIREGCAEPQEVAREVLAKFAVSAAQVGEQIYEAADLIPMQFHLEQINATIERCAQRLEQFYLNSEGKIRDAGALDDYIAAIRKLKDEP